MSDIFDPGKDFDPAQAAKDAEDAYRSEQGLKWSAAGPAAQAQAYLNDAAKNPGKYTRDEIAQWESALVHQQAALSMGRTSGTSEAKVEAAKAADHLTSKGCLSGPLIAAVGAIAVLIAIAWALLGGPLKSEDEGESAGQESRSPSTPPAAASQPTGAGAGSDGNGAVADLSTFAGRWDYVSGLDDPTGADVPEGPGSNSYSVVLGAPDASFTIGEDGVITDGFYQASSDGTGAACGSLSVDADLDSASGNVTGPDGAGFVTWQGSSYQEGPCVGNTEGSYTAQAVVTLQFWISGDSMTLCRSLMASPTSCANGRVTAIFERS